MNERLPGCDASDRRGDIRVPIERAVGFHLDRQTGSHAFFVIP